MPGGTVPRAMDARTPSRQARNDASWLVGSYNEVIDWGTVMWMAVLAVIHFIVNRSMRTALAIR